MTIDHKAPKGPNNADEFNVIDQDDTVVGQNEIDRLNTLPFLVPDGFSAVGGHATNPELNGKAFVFLTVFGNLVNVPGVEAPPRAATVMRVDVTGLRMLKEAVDSAIERFEGKYEIL